MGRKKRALVAMSGGVDSSVAAYLLKEQGYDVAGATMYLGSPGMEGGKGGCLRPDVIFDARKICEKLGIPHYVLDYEEELKEKVIGRFVEEYKRGRTPNPCIECNRHLKFGSLLKKAREWGFDFLATGHYASVTFQDGFYALHRPRDRRKDQTYFLYAISPECLPFLLFPLAPLTKEEVRNLAEKLRFPSARKEESQDICFIRHGHYGEFLQVHLPAIKRGPIKDLSGETIGEHKGIFYYTIGQRTGLGISAKKPLYVVAIDPVENSITVGEKKDLYATDLIAKEVNILSPRWSKNLTGKVRYRKKEAPCRAEMQGNKLYVHFEEPQEAITPGQAVVLYEGDMVVGGGMIEKVIKDLS